MGTHERILLSLLLIIQLLWPQQLLAEQAAGDSGTTQTQQLDLDLSSRQRVHEASSLGNFAPTAIRVGRDNRTVSPSDLLTAAEYVALSQVLSSGEQSLKVGRLGNAVGGSLDLSAHVSGQIANLLVPRGVTAVQDFGAAQALNIGGNLTNAGRLFAVSSNSSVTTAIINADNIFNQRGALISSVLPRGGLSGYENLVANLNLSLNALTDIVNQGTISSAGNLSMTAGGSMINSLPAGVTGAAPVIQAFNNLNVLAGSGTLVNSGLMSAMNGNLNLLAGAQKALSLQNTQGTLEALSGSINVGDALSTAKTGVTLTGGDFFAQEINLYGGNGAVNVNVGQVEGLLNVTGGSVIVNADTPNLRVGDVTATGDPLFSSTTDYTISGNITTNGNPLTIIAGRDILVSGNNRRVDSSNTGGNGGDILMVAGAQFDPPTSTLTITGGSSSGGKIDLFTDNSNDVSVIDSSSGGAGNGNGGKITLVAYKGTNSDSGTIELPVGVTVSTVGKGTGTNGSFLAIANGNNRTVFPGESYSIYLDAIDTDQGTSVGGTIEAYTATPTLVGGSVVIDATSGAVTSGSFSPASTLVNSSIRVSTLSSQAGVIKLRAGTDIKAAGNISVSRSLGSGSSGTIDWVAINGSIDATGFSLFADNGGGNAGTITLTAGTNITHNDASAQATGTGTGGMILETAGNNITGNSFRASAKGFGNQTGGTIKVLANGKFAVIQDLRANASGTGKGGTIVAQGFDIGQQSGNIIWLANGDGSANGGGDGGSICIIDLNPSGTVTIGTGLSEFVTSATALGPGGKGGIITIVTGNLDVQSWNSMDVRGTAQNGTMNLVAQGDISFSGSQGGINLTPTSGSGDGGNFSLVAGGNITMDTGGANIISNGAGTGNGGNITIKAGGSLNLLNTSVIANGAGSGSGGNIVLSGGNGNATVVVDTDNCANCTLSFAGNGTGNTLIDGNVTANGGATGKGGNITLQTASSTRFDVEVGETTNGVDGAISATGGSTSGGGGSVTVENFGTGGIFVATPSTGIVVTTTDGAGGSIKLDAGAGATDGPLTLGTNSLSVNATGSGANAGGTIYLRGSTFSFPAGITSLTADGSGTGNGGGVTAIVTGATSDLLVDNVSGGMTVSARSGASGGNGGTVTLSAGRNLTIDGGDLTAGPRGTNGDGPTINLTAGTGSSGTLTINNTLNADGAGTGGGGSVSMTACDTVGSNVVISSGASVTATGSGGDISITTHTLTNNGGLTASNEGSGFILITSCDSLTLQGTGASTLQGTGTSSITVQVNGTNSITFAGDQTFNPGSASSSLIINAQASGGSVRFNDNTTQTVQSGSPITVSTPSISLGNNALLSATGASNISINSGGGANPLTITLDNGESGTISTAGGTVAIAPTSGQSLTFAKTTGAGTSILNLDGGPVTTTTSSAGTAVNSNVVLDSNSTITMNVNGSTLTNNGTVRSSATGNSLTAQTTSTLTLAGTGTWDQTNGGTTRFLCSDCTNGEIRFAANANQTVAGSGDIQIGTRLLTLESNASLNASGASTINITPACPAPITITAEGGSSGTISTNGGQINITPTAGQFLLFDRTGSSGTATINFLGGPVTTTTTSTTTVNSNVLVTSNNTITMNVNGSTMTNNGTVRTTASGDSLVVQSTTSLSLAGTGTFDQDGTTPGTTRFGCGCGATDEIRLLANANLTVEGGGEVRVATRSLVLETSAALGASGPSLINVEPICPSSVTITAEGGSSGTLSTVNGNITIRPTAGEFLRYSRSGSGTTTINLTGGVVNTYTTGSTTTIDSNVIVSGNQNMFFHVTNGTFTNNGTATTSVNDGRFNVQADTGNLTIAGTGTLSTTGGGFPTLAIAVFGPGDTIFMTGSQTFDAGNGRVVWWAQEASSGITISANQTQTVNGDFLYANTHIFTMESNSTVQSLGSTDINVLSEHGPLTVVAPSGSQANIVALAGAPINIIRADDSNNAITFAKSGTDPTTLNLLGGQALVQSDNGRQVIDSGFTLHSNNDLTMRLLHTSTLEVNGTITDSKPGGFIFIDAVTGSLTLAGTPNPITATGGADPHLRIAGGTLTFNSSYSFDLGNNDGGPVIVGNTINLAAGTTQTALNENGIKLEAEVLNIGAGASIVSTRTSGKGICLSWIYGPTMTINLPANSAASFITSGAGIEAHATDLLSIQVTGGSGTSTLILDGSEFCMMVEGSISIGAGVTLDATGDICAELNGPTNTFTNNGTITTSAANGSIEILGHNLTLAGNPQPISVTGGGAAFIMVNGYGGLTINGSYTFDAGSGGNVQISASTGSIAVAANQTLSIAGGSTLLLNTPALTLNDGSLISVVKSSGTGITFSTPVTSLTVSAPGGSTATLKTSGAAINISPLGGGLSLSFLNSGGSGIATFQLNDGPVTVSTDEAPITIGANVIVTSNYNLTLRPNRATLVNNGTVSTTSAAGFIAIDNAYTVNNAGSISAATNTNISIISPYILSIIGSGSLSAIGGGITVSSTSGSVTATQGSVTGILSGIATLSGGTSQNYSFDVGSGNLTIGNISTLQGSIIITTGSGSGVLTVADGSTVQANEGNLTLQNNNVTGGSIVIGANSTLGALTASKSTGLGNVYIGLGAAPGTPDVGPNPGNVTLSELGGGQVYFGTNGITASAPNNTLNAWGANIVFDTKSRPASAISLEGNVTITADPPVTGGVALAPAPAPVRTIRLLAESPSRGSAANAAGSGLPGLNLRIVPADASTHALPTGVIFPLSFAPSVPVYHEVTGGSAGSLPSPSDTGVEQGSPLEPIAYVRPAVSPSSQGLVALQMGEGSVKHLGPAQLIQEPSGALVLKKGEVLISTTGDTTVRSGNHSIYIAEGALVLINSKGTVLRVRNLFEGRAHSVRTLIDGEYVDIAAGQELVVGQDQASVVAAVNDDNLGRRNVRQMQTRRGTRLVRSEIPLAALMKSNTTLAYLMQSQDAEDRRAAVKLVKMAACLMLTTAARGPYSLPRL
jgi:hypothetical protein